MRQNSGRSTYVSHQEVQVGFNVFPRYREAVSDDSGDQRKWLIRLIPVPAESRDYSLNSGGNTDEGFALSI